MTADIYSALPQNTITRSLALRIRIRAKTPSGPPGDRRLTCRGDEGFGFAKSLGRHTAAMPEAPVAPVAATGNGHLEEAEGLTTSDRAGAAGLHHRQAAAHPDQMIASPVIALPGGQAPHPTPGG